MREKSASPCFHGSKRMKQGRSKPRALDLLSGTKSVARALEAMGFEVVTVDKDPAWHPDICVDVLPWEYWQLRPMVFQVIFVSPPWTKYRQALTTRPTNFQAVHAVVWRTLKIIRHFCPQQWFMENPTKREALIKTKDEGLILGLMSTIVS